MIPVSVSASLGAELRQKYEVMGGAPVEGLSTAVEMVGRVRQVFKLGMGVQVFECNGEDGPPGCPVITEAEYTANRMS